MKNELNPKDFHVVDHTLIRYLGNKRVIYVPSSIDGEEITAIGPGAFCYRRQNDIAIILPDTITDIQEGAFNSLYFLNAFVVPDSVLNIGYDAFGGSCSIWNMYIGNSVTSMDEFIFGHDDSHNPTIHTSNPYVIDYMKTNYPNKKVMIEMGVNKQNQIIGAAPYFFRERNKLRNQKI